jgi:hypothetical protein
MLALYRRVKNDDGKWADQKRQKKTEAHAS